MAPRASARSVAANVRLREQISNLQSLFMLSMLMTENQDEEEILRLASTSVSSLGPFRVEGGYLRRDGRLVRSPASPGGKGRGLAAQLEDLGGGDRPVALPDSVWGWAYSLRSLGGHWGYLVIGAPAEPSPDEQFLLRVLIQQTGAALANATLHGRERTNAVALESVNKQLVSVNDQLTATVSYLERTTRIHEVLTQVAASGEGEEGIARAVHQLTGRPVAVEDRFGNLRSWAGPGRPEPYPKSNETKRAKVLRLARRDRRPVRDGDRLIALAQPRDEVLGVLALVDPDGTAGPHDVFALEHGAVVLAMELAHLRSLAEMELRLRRDLVDDLLTGTDDQSALLRAQAIAYDLRRPHHAVVVRGRGRATGEVVARAVEHAAAELEIGSLLGRRTGTVVLLAYEPSRWEELHHRLAVELGSAPALGVGGRCLAPADFPRSYQEALLALRVRESSLRPEGVTCFEELGVYRILAAGESRAEIEQFVREWLGRLLDYDTKHRSELVKTLSHYLECGGNYDETAEALVIHRSTLRYRLQRIREVTGLNLNDVDSRFNLHVATRAWTVLGGSL